MIDYSIFFDFETAGLKSRYPNIQLAAVAIQTDGWIEADTFEEKIQFDPAKASKEALRVNSYDHKLWLEKAIPEESAASKFALWLRPFRCLEMISKNTGQPYTVCRMHAHNAAFDGPRLKGLMRHGFLPIDLRIRCSLQRALWWYDSMAAFGVKPPADFKLATLCASFGISVSTDRHDALTDARMCAAITREMSRIPVV